MPDKFLFNTLTWPEVNESVREGRVVLLPVGAIEQHGPHLPLDTDNVGVVTVCERAAEREPSLLLCMPPVHYGFNEQGLDFPGTISITEHNFIGYCYDVCASLARMGFNKILVVNGHGGNTALLEVVGRLVTARTPALAAMVNYYELTKEAVEKHKESDWPGSVDHGGEYETSIYLAHAPNLVKEELMQRGEPFGKRGRWFWGGISGYSSVRMMNVVGRMITSGVAGDPTFASAEKGEAFIAAAVENLIDVAREFKELEIRPIVSHLVTSGQGTKRGDL